MNVLFVAERGRELSVDVFDRVEDAARVRHVVVLERVRERRVEARHARDRGFHVLDDVLGDQRADLAAEAAEARRLVHDDHAAGLLGRFEHALFVERQQRAQVDDRHSMPFSAACSAAFCTPAPSRRSRTRSRPCPCATVRSVDSGVV
jgi:hypothetical protein